MSSAGRPASSRMTWPSAAVTVSSGPTGAAPCDTHGMHLDAREGEADGAVAAQLVAEEEGGVAVQRAGAGDPAEHRHARGAPRELGEHEIGRERVGVGQQDDGGRLLELGQPADGDRVGALGDVEMEGLRASLAERRRPDGHRGAALDLAPVADHAAGAAADQHGRGERLVDALERRLGRRQVRARREDAHHVGALRPRARRAPADPPRSPRGAGRGWSTARSRCARSPA